MTPARKALLLGATGLTGSVLLYKLLQSDHYVEIHIISRRSTGITHPKLTEHILQLTELDRAKNVFRVDDLYNQVKGELENALKQELPIPNLHIFQPTMLLGRRTESRPSETLAIRLTRWLRPIFRGSLYLLRGIYVETVAEAMYQTALQRRAGIHTYGPREMETWTNN